MTTTWGMPEERSLESGPLLLPFAVATFAGVLVAIVVGFITNVIAGIVVGALVGVASIVWARSQGRVALFTLHARPADADTHARLINLVEGLSQQTENGVPAVYVIDMAQPNALATRVGGNPVVAVTSGLLDELVRTELEAVTAHCLVRVGRALTMRASVACSLGPMMRSVAPPVGYDDDVRAVALTRYPPALAKALHKMQPTSPRFGPMWMIASDDVHRPVGERIAALGDL